mgnify:CR=1 FL=1
MARPILAPALLAAAIATSVCVSPALADDVEETRRFRVATYSLAFAEAVGQMSGITAQCFNAAEMVSEGRVVVLDMLDYALNVDGLNRAADAYDRGVREMRAQYAISCKGADETRRKLSKDSDRYLAEISKLVGFDEKTKTFTNSGKNQ